MSREIAVNTEIWMRPNPWAQLDALQAAIAGHTITRTPRLGMRDRSHPKGYYVGQKTALVLQPHGQDRNILTVPIVVTGLTIRPLGDFTPEELSGCGLEMRRWPDVRKALGFFEGRLVRPEEIVTLVSFTYLQQEEGEKLHG